MKEARFEYKCRRCGRVDDGLCCGDGLAFERLVGLLVRGHDVGLGFKVGMVSAHSCPDGGTGVADLQGYGVTGGE